MTVASRKPGFIITGRHVLIGFVLFFGVIIATDALFVVLAYRTFSGQVASNPYEAGLAYNATLARKARQDAMGWSASVSDADGVLSLTIVDAAQRPVDDLKVVATLQRPATEQGRRTLRLPPVGEGRYAAPLTIDGAWDVRVVAERPDGVSFEAERRLVRR